ncbi:DUF805 domain-containing protein [Sphingomonas bacterium]|uniref:DUF805 domain-containing protein n=1 Tax=Sphingomonas bacterium TaxID=1895847 RepID=UPI002628B2CD|nr:DUF805 domain-containing protein [Sphingomonas bacterium]MDB5680109.1 hypothetical protein [Sphingomonas bacterium]
MELLLRPWRHYADFNGRSRRGEYWLFKLTFWGGFLLLALIGGVFGDLAGRSSGEPMGAAGIAGVALAVIYFLASIIPGWALTVRRLHDQGTSGWLILTTFIPYIGLIFVLVFGCIPGNDFENEYGPDPRLPDAESREALGELFS